MLDISANEYVNNLQHFGANVVLINAAGIISSYPTQLPYHFQSPYLQGDRWLAEHFIPPEYHLEMKAKKFSMHELMSEKASMLKPGESGLLALDWWNGNRSVLIDSDLTGLIVGFTLQTRAEDVYLALLEATAFGVRLIIDNFRKHDVKVDSLCAMGGISQKSPLAMQILANVLNMKIRVPKTTQGSALGSAILGAVAAGNKKGGYDDLFEAVKQMSSKENTFFYPNEAV